MNVGILKIWSWEMIYLVFGLFDVQKNNDSGCFVYPLNKKSLSGNADEPGSAETEL